MEGTKPSMNAARGARTKCRSPHLSLLCVFHRLRSRAPLLIRARSQPFPAPGGLCLLQRGDGAATGSWGPCFPGGGVCPLRSREHRLDASKG